LTGADVMSFAYRGVCVGMCTLFDLETWKIPVELQCGARPSR
jgi:hypothetical protein